MTDTPAQLSPLLHRVLENSFFSLRRLEFPEDNDIERVKTVQNAARGAKYDLEALIREWTPQLEF